jgi:type VI secretion system protein ImpK
MSNPIAPIASYHGASPALAARGWNLAIAFQDVFTVIVRLRSNRQEVTNADAFRNNMKQALGRAEQEARTAGYSGDDVRQCLFVIVAFLDESVLQSRHPVFADWPRLPLQTEMFGNMWAGEIVFQELQKTLGQPDSQHVCDVLEVYGLCLLLGFKGRYAAGGAGDLQALIAAIQDKIRRVRVPSGMLSPRGLLPSDAVLVSRSDPWVRKFAIAAASAVLLTVILFLVYWLALNSGVSGLAVFFM